MAKFSGGGAMQGAASGAMLGATLAAPTGGMSVPVGALLGALGGVGMGFMGGGDEGPDIDINAEMARINSLYERARTEGTAAITQDFQAQRGELAQSQAARGILRSGVSQLGLARLGAARQQALGQFNAQLYAAQAGQQSNLMNALLGRKTALDTASADRSRQGMNQMFGALSGVAGAYAGSRGVSPAGPATTQGGFNFAGGNMVSPQSTTPQGFYQTEFGAGGFGGQNYGASPTNWTGQGFR